MQVALDGPRMQKEGGLSDYHRWKLSQPGFMNTTRQGAAPHLGWSFRSNRKVEWDGTFNQPIMPLADAKSKLATGYRFQ